MTRFVLLAAAMAVGTAASAAGPLELTARVMVEAKQRAADGSTKVALVPARKVVPGDRLVYILSYRNTGAQPLGDVVLDNPLPPGIAYLAPAPGTPAPEVSADGKRFALPGAGAAPDGITHVRWRLTRPLAAGARGELAFRAILK